MRASTARRHPLHRVHDAGCSPGCVPLGRSRDYRLEVAYGDGEHRTVDDPYRFLPTLGELDLHLIGEGRHEQLWDVLGAHVRALRHRRRSPARRSRCGRRTPAAVRVVGDFNCWDGRAHPMRSLGSSGVWELFVPGVGAGTRYKFEILGAGRPVAREGRPDGLRHRGARRPPRRVVTDVRVRLGTTTTGWPQRAPTTRCTERR